MFAAALLGASGVILGAYGAHGLEAYLNPNRLHLLDTWDTAVLYQLVHAVVLLNIGFREKVSRALNVATYCFVIGVLLFSGSLYGLVLLEATWLGPITPIGGVFFIVGWVSLMVASIRKGSSERF